MSANVKIKLTRAGYRLLGGARFVTADRHELSGDRVSVSAEGDLHERKPIQLSINSGPHHTFACFSADEAEALASCLTHAVAIRREAETQQGKLAA